MDPMLAALISTASGYSAVLLTASPQSDYLMQSAQQQAEYQARVCEQGHQNWDERKYAIEQSFSGQVDVEEICAESWPLEYQDDKTPVGIGRGMWDSWRQSPGHWAVCTAAHKHVGYGIAQGRNGVWYATIQVAD
jgi:hypothetical protein